MDKWRIHQIANGEWALQKLRTDAVQPYYLTERIYRFEPTARRVLNEVMKTGQIPK